MTDAGTSAADVQWMNLCIALAAKGRGRVSPNPMVGAVIVRGAEVLGKGYHQRFGGAHAEVNAVRDALRRGHTVEGATLYVSLEPCYHHGKTPPCVELVIGQKFGRVVVAAKDPNPLVNGKSIRALTKAGIACTVGVCRGEAKKLNEAFYAWFRNNRPLVALKTAQTADGFIAHTDGSSKWITNPQSRKKVHELRASYDAILIGAGTALADDPMLTVRSVKGSNPLRVLLDGKLRVPLDAALLKTAGEIATIVYTARTTDAVKREKIVRMEAMGAVVVQMSADRKKRIPVEDVLADLGQHKIMSVLVEGGADVYGCFLRAKTADILYQFTSPKLFGKGISGISGDETRFRKKRRTHLLFGNDAMDEYVLTYE